MGKAIPLLRIFDEAKAREFYIDWLGFQVDFEHRFHDNAPLYLGISLGTISLHLTEHHGDCTPGAKIFIEGFENIKEYHSDLKKKGYKYNNPGIGPAFYDPKMLCFDVADPFGNKLWFNGPA